MKSFLQKIGVLVVIFLLDNKVFYKTLIILELDIGLVFITSHNRSHFLKR